MNKLSTLHVGNYNYIVDAESGKEIAISRSTGECSEAITAILPVGSSIYTPEDIRFRAERNRQIAEYFSTKKTYKPLGKFIFVALDDDFTQVNPSTLSRIIYLATFMRYGKNKLYKSQRKQLNITDLPKIMNLSASTVRRFIKEAHPKYIKVDNQGFLEPNNKVFKYGKLSSGEKKKSWQKIFIKNYRSLYTETKECKQKYIGYILQNLQNINIHRNILCMNPYESDETSLTPMSLREFCEKIGYCYSAVSRLKKEFRKLKFIFNGNSELFCVVDTTGTITVNPHIIFSGKNLESLLKEKNEFMVPDNVNA